MTAFVREGGGVKYGVTKDLLVTMYAFNDRGRTSFEFTCIYGLCLQWVWGVGGGGYALLYYCH